VEGRCSAGADETQGIVAGTYHITRKESTIQMEVRPQKAWQPTPGPLWVTTWVWHATLSFVAEHDVSIRAKWSRIGPDAM
jgi:hypothetical protein